MEAELSPHEVASRLFAALRERDLGLIRTLDHPDVVRDFVAIAEFRGVDACQGFFVEMLGAFPDFDIEVGRTLSDGDHVVAQWLATGTFSGTPFRGVHATGRRVELRGCEVMHFDQGRLMRSTVYYDGLGFARQIGLLPAEGSVGDKALTATFIAGTDLRARLHLRAESTAH